MDLSHDEIERITSEKLRSLDFDDDFYNKESLEILNENNEIDCCELGFMRGYLDS